MTESVNVIAPPDSAIATIQTAPFKKAVRYWQEIEVAYGHEGRRWLCRNDRYFFLTAMLHRKDALHPWLYDRCREVEANPDNYLDLWAREHYKSTIITFAGALQEIIRNPDITIGIFSHTRKVAIKFLRQLKSEMESNQDLKDAYPEIFWQAPKKQAPRWSDETGLIVIRKSNPKEATIEAWGLVDGQPTGAHFILRIYDDVVTKESVNTPEQAAKTTEAWELSDNLGAANEDGDPGRCWHIGTRYSFGDSYQVILDRKALVPRIYPATKDGTPDGELVFLTPEAWADKKIKQGAATIACHASGTRILMSDWTNKPIEDVVVGDSVVGILLGRSGIGKGSGKALLCKTDVIAISSRMSPVFEYTLESGRTVACTEDHKWWTGRNSGSRNKYGILGFRKHDISALCMVTEVDDAEQTIEQIRAASYLAGIFDGEGSASGFQIRIAQSEKVNPHICKRIRNAIKILGFEFTEHRPKSRPEHIEFLLTGGRDARHRFLRLLDPGKRPAIVKTMFTRDNIGKNRRDKLVSVRHLGDRLVHNIQTITGNYVAEGYASKNCQMLQNPIAGDQAMFKKEYLSWAEVRPPVLNIYILCDPAGSKKKGTDKTAFAVVGIDAQRVKYLLDGYHHKMSLRERWTALKGLRKHWMAQPGIQVVHVGYERYGMQSDAEYFKERMEVEGDTFELQELAWPSEGPGSKFDRIQRLEPDFRNRRFYLIAQPTSTNLTSIQARMVASNQPHLVLAPVRRKDETGKIYNLTLDFVQQFLAYPFTSHEDMLDATSRIYDMDARPPILIDDKILEPETFDDGA
mgnify:FL=1